MSRKLKNLQAGKNHQLSVGKNLQNGDIHREQYDQTYIGNCQIINNHYNIVLNQNDLAHQNFSKSLAAALPEVDLSAFTQREKNRDLYCSQSGLLRRLHQVQESSFTGQNQEVFYPSSHANQQPQVLENLRPSLLGKRKSRDFVNRDHEERNQEQQFHDAGELDDSEYYYSLNKDVQNNHKIISQKANKSIRQIPQNYAVQISKEKKASSFCSLQRDQLAFLKGSTQSLVEELVFNLFPELYIQLKREGKRKFHPLDRERECGIAKDQLKLDLNLLAQISSRVMVNIALLDAHKQDSHLFN